jgi:hypothetical protein
MTAFFNITGSTVLSLVASYLVMAIYTTVTRNDDDEAFDFEATLATLPGNPELASNSEGRSTQVVTHRASTECAGEV